MCFGNVCGCKEYSSGLRSDKGRDRSNGLNCSNTNVAECFWKSDIDWCPICVISSCHRYCCHSHLAGEMTVQLPVMELLFKLSSSKLQKLGFILKLIKTHEGWAIIGWGHGSWKSVERGAFLEELVGSLEDWLIAPTVRRSENRVDCRALKNISAMQLIRQELFHMLQA